MRRHGPLLISFFFFLKPTNTVSCKDAIWRIRVVENACISAKVREKKFERKSLNNIIIVSTGPAVRTNGRKVSVKDGHAAIYFICIE